MKRTKRTVAAASMSLAFLAFVGAAYFGSGCELIVQLDRSLADAGSDDVVLGVCPICTPLDDGSADGETDASALTPDASDAATVESDAASDAAKDASDTGAD
jgi:hypothetical protein